MDCMFKSIPHQLARPRHAQKEPQMRKPKHTPGPWKVTPLTGWCHQVLPKTSTIDEHCMNAHLIAAAPEMLDALKELTDRLLNCHGGDERELYKANPRCVEKWKQALRAIAKAEGRDY